MADPQQDIYTVVYEGSGVQENVYSSVLAPDYEAQQAVGDPVLDWERSFGD